MTATAAPALPLLRDSRGDLLRARTFSATAVHTPKPENPGRTLCGGGVALLSEFTCEGAAGSYRDWENDPQRGRQVTGCPEHGMSKGLHRTDLAACAGPDPQLCLRCEVSVARRSR